MDILDGKVVIITGASKGVGRIMSQRFAAAGAKVVCAARSSALVEETAQLIRNAGGQAAACTADAATEDGARQIVRAAMKSFGRLDALVNNAGDGGPTKPVQDYLTQEWHDTIDSCLTSSYMMTRFTVPELIKSQGGAIVYISSVAGRRGIPNRIGYCAGKAGQMGMTYGMALELAPYDITVNAIAPGSIEGERINRVIAAKAKLLGIPESDMRREFVESAPLKRMVTADDIAATAVFLCGPSARNLSGQCISVSAGIPAC